MSSKLLCTVCGGLRELRQPHFSQHVGSRRHLDAVRKWDEEHSPLAKQTMSRHDFHVWLRIGCGQLAEPAAA